jgi:hypothetical protein
MELNMKFGIRFSCDVSDKRDIEVVVEGKVGNVKRRMNCRDDGDGAR